MGVKKLMMVRMFMNVEEMKKNGVYNYFILKCVKSFFVFCVFWWNVSEVIFIDLSEWVYSFYIMYLICVLYKSLVIYIFFYVDELFVVFDIFFIILLLVNGMWFCLNCVVGVLEIWFMFCCWYMCLLYFMRLWEGLYLKGCLWFKFLFVSCVLLCLYLLWGGWRFLGWDLFLWGLFDFWLLWLGCL